MQHKAEHDALFCYYSKHSHKPGVGRVRVYNDKRHVLLTDIDISAASVTNNVEVIAAKLMALNLIKPDTAVIEHYERKPRIRPLPTFDIVTIINNQPYWKNCNLEEVAQMLQCPEAELTESLEEIEHLKLEAELLRKALAPQPISKPCRSDLLPKRPNDVFKAELQNMLDERKGETDLHRFLEANVMNFAEQFACPDNEFIVFSEFTIDEYRVDFMVLTGRSRMDAHIIEIKGADIPLSKAAGNHRDYRSEIHDAITQIQFHHGKMQFNETVAQKIHAERARAEAWHKSYALKPCGRLDFAVGEQPRLEVSAEKGLNIYYHVIGGYGTHLSEESRLRHRTEDSMQAHVRIDSWNSWLNRHYGQDNPETNT